MLDSAASFSISSFLLPKAKAPKVFDASGLEPKAGAGGDLAFSEPNAPNTGASALQSGDSDPNVGLAVWDPKLNPDESVVLDGCVGFEETPKANPPMVGGGFSLSGADGFEEAPKANPPTA